MRNQVTLWDEGALEHPTLDSGSDLSLDAKVSGQLLPESSPA
jgi:hypothetical protein